MQYTLFKNGLCCFLLSCWRYIQHLNIYTICLYIYKQMVHINGFIRLNIYKYIWLLYWEPTVMTYKYSLNDNWNIHIYNILLVYRYRFDYISKDIYTNSHHISVHSFPKISDLLNDRSAPRTVWLISPMTLTSSLQLVLKICILKYSI